MARRRRSRVRPAAVLIFLGALALAVGCLITQRAIDQQNARIAELTEQRDALIEANAELRDEISFTYTDEYFRREAHRLGYIAEDETLYSLDDNMTDSAD